MKLFRRGTLFLAYTSLDRAFTFDAETKAVSRERSAADLMHDPKQWMPVHDDDLIPPALADLLVVKFRPKG